MFRSAFNFKPERFTTRKRWRSWKMFLLFDLQSAPVVIDIVKDTATCKSIAVVATTDFASL